MPTVRNMKTGEELSWKVNTPQFLKELASNPNIAPIAVTLQIFANILAEVGERALELNDPKLNALMCRLALYEQSDPYSKEYDKEMTDKCIHQFYNKTLRNEKRNTKQ